jgi:hypothetical protein
MSSKTAASAALAVVLLSSGAAHAQAAADSTIAQSLFDEGRKLMAEKKFADACPRLERSYKLDPAAGTLLNLAVCHEGQGKTATALSEFRDSVALARRENRNDRLTFAQKHVDALKGRICTLTVLQGGHETGLEWKVDGAKVGTESLGIALPIDPGSHTVEASAPGMRPWQTTFEIKRDGETKALEIPALVALPKDTVVETHPVVAAPVAVESSHGPSPWIWVTIGVGAVGFGAMALGGVESLSYWSDRKAACGIGGDPNACTQAGLDADKTARTWALVADIGLGVGVAGTLATILVAAVGRPKPKDATHAIVSPFVSPNAAGFALSTVF